MIWGIAFLAGVFCFLVLAAVLLKVHVAAHHVDVQTKVQPYMESSPLRTVPQPKKKWARRFWGIGSQWIHPLGERLSRLPQTITLETYMQQADLPFRGADFLVLLCLVGMISGLAGALLLQHVAAGLVVGIGAVAACLFWLRFYIHRRRSAFAYQLGDALTMMSNAMRAGFSFDQAMELIGHEMTPPISSEFMKVLMATQLGSDLETALGQLEQRIPSKDLSLVITAVLIQRQVGGDLSRILDIVAETIRERIRMQREVRTLTAQGRLSGYVLVGLPFAFAGLMTVVNPDFMKPMLTESLGRVLIVMGLVLDGIGLMIIRKLIRVEL